MPLNTNNTSMRCQNDFETYHVVYRMRRTEFSLSLKLGPALRCHLMSWCLSFFICETGTKIISISNTVTVELMLMKCIALAQNRKLYIQRNGSYLTWKLI